MGDNSTSYSRFQRFVPGSGDVLHWLGVLNVLAHVKEGIYIGDLVEEIWPSSGGDNGIQVSSGIPTADRRTEDVLSDEFIAVSE